MIEPARVDFGASLSAILSREFFLTRDYSRSSYFLSLFFVARDVSLDFFFHLKLVLKGPRTSKKYDVN